MGRMPRNGGQQMPFPELLLPDDWPGERIKGARRVREAQEELLVPDWIHPAWADWTRVTVIGRDPWAVTGMRHILARCGAIRLRVLRDIPAECKTGLNDTDVVVWLRLRNDGQSELSGHIARIRRTCPWIKQFVISDALPRNMARGPSALSGVWTAHAGEGCETLYSLLARVLTAPPPAGPLLSRMLNRSQWRVLLLRARGLNTKDIAATCRIGYKTVSVHESAIRERLGIENRAEYAWLLRSVSLIQTAVPGLARESYRTTGELSCRR